MKRAYVDISEGQMHYRYVGMGQPIVLLHMSGSSSDEFEKVGDMLSAQFCVYAPDLLGFGESDTPPGHYSLEEHANTIIRFMDALQLEKAVVGGNMVGANIAARIAAQWPERVCGLLLSNLAYDPDYERFKSAINLPIFQKVDLAQDGSHLLEYWRRAAQYGEAVEIAEARALCLHKAGKHGESLHWALFQDRDYKEILPAISAKTVVVALGRVPSAKVQPQVAGLIPGAKYEIIENATPYVARANSQEFSRIILDTFIIE